MEVGSWKQIVTHLVIDLSRVFRKHDLLLPEFSDLLELLALGPAVKGSRHVHFLGGMRPVVRLSS